MIKIFFSEEDGYYHINTGYFLPFTQEVADKICVSESMKKALLFLEANRHLIHPIDLDNKPETIAVLEGVLEKTGFSPEIIDSSYTKGFQILLPGCLYFIWQDPDIFDMRKEWDEIWKEIGLTPIKDSYKVDHPLTDCWDFIVGNNK